MRLGTRGAILVVGVVATLFGGGLLAAGCHLRGRAAKAATWPTVEGTVTRSEVLTGTFTTGTGIRHRSTTMYTPSINYAYKVDGRLYEGDRLLPLRTWSTSSMSEARAKVDHHPVGSKVRVYVNPADPADACLEPSVGPLPMISIGAGSVVLLIGLAATALRVIRYGLV